MTAKARVAVIGTGWWSTYTHIPGVQASPRAELIAVCDSHPQRLRAAAEAYSIGRTYANVTAMLANETLDGVVIATPHATHYAIAKECLEHGLHVLLEKPMTLFASEAEALVALARTQGREIIIGYPWHYTPHARRAREVIRSGVLGSVQYVNCALTSSVAALLRGDDHVNEDLSIYPVHGPGAVYSQPELSGGGQGHLQITHSAGLLFFVTNLRARRVMALMNNHGLPLDLVDAMIVEFDGGALGNVSGTGNSSTYKLDLQIRCEHGGIDLGVDGERLSLHIRRGKLDEIGPVSDQEAYPRFATTNNLVDVILGHATNGSPAEDGWRTVELLDAAYRSARLEGQAIWVKDLYP